MTSKRQVAAVKSKTLTDDTIGTKMESSVDMLDKLDENGKDLPIKEKSEKKINVLKSISPAEINFDSIKMKMASSILDQQKYHDILKIADAGGPTVCGCCGSQMTFRFFAIFEFIWLIISLAIDFVIRQLTKGGILPSVHMYLYLGLFPFSLSMYWVTCLTIYTMV